MQYRLRIARSRAHGSVDIASEKIEARGVSEAIVAASRAMDLFLADLPGVGILTDAVEGASSGRAGGTCHLRLSPTSSASEREQLDHQPLRTPGRLGNLLVRHT